MEEHLPEHFKISTIVEVSKGQGSGVMGKKETKNPIEKPLVREGMSAVFCFRGLTPKVAARQIRNTVSCDLRYPESLELDRTSSFRREAFIRSFSGEATEKEVREFIAQLSADARDFLRDQYFDQFATNLDVAGKMARELLNDPEPSQQITAEALAHAPKITNKWVLQEKYWRQAAHYHQKNDKKRTLASMVAALGIYNKYPIVLEPIWTPNGPQPHDQLEDVKRFGFKEDALREHGVAPSSSTPIGRPLDLSVHQVASVVEKCLKCGR